MLLTLSFADDGPLLGLRPAVSLAQTGLIILHLGSASALSLDRGGVRYVLGGLGGRNGGRQDRQSEHKRGRVRWKLHLCQLSSLRRCSCNRKLKNLFEIRNKLSLGWSGTASSPFGGLCGATKCQWLPLKVFFGGGSQPINGSASAPLCADQQGWKK